MKKRNILAMILAGCLVFSSGTTFASTQKYVLAGENRYETAVKVSEYGFNRASNVVLVNGTSIADALSATPYAKMKDAPILLTEKNSLNFDTRDEIRRLKASNVYIVGGKSVVSDSVANDLKKLGCNVYRIAGSDRYETSLNVAKEMDKKEDISEVAVVNGITGLADALSVASPAASRHIPIILSSRDNLWGSEKWMNDEKISKSYIIGGKAAISVDVENKLNNSERLFGQNRWETNAEVLEYFFNTNDLYNVYLAKDGSLNQNQLVDALAAGSVAAKENSPVILLGTELHGTQEEYLKSRNSKLLTEVGYGLNRKAVEKVNFTLNFKNVGETEVGFVDYKNCEQIQIHFGSPIDESTVIYNGKLKRDVIDISATDDHTIEGDIDGLDEFYARLESDKKTLTITRDISKGKIFNGTYDIRVSDKVKTKDGLSLEPYVERLRIVDQIAPQVESVIYNDTYGELTINFSEPIKKFPNITIDGKYVTEDQNVSFSNTKDKIVLNRKKLNELESIGRTIQIIVDGSKDYRGLEMVRYAQSIRLVKPSEERKVESVKLKNSKEMEILFASPINPNSVLDSNGKILKNNISITSVGDNKEDSIIGSGDDLYGSLSPDKRTLVIKRDFNNDKFFEGKYNVLVTENVMTIDNANIVKHNETVKLSDSKKPEVTSIKYDERTGKITITFSEPIKKKPIITMTGGYIDKGKSVTFKETEMTLNTATRDSITISYEAIKEHNLVKYDEPDGKEYEITVENANDFAENVQQKYGPKKIHIKPMDEGFKVDKVEIFDKNNRKNGENVFLVYFNEKINKPTGKNFGLEGIATEASLIEFVENPETKVNDSKVVKVTFGEGTVNVGKTDGTDETEGSGPKLANLTIKDIKAQSGRILRYAEGTVTVRDNTSPFIVEQKYEASSGKLTLQYSEKMNFEDETILKQVAKFAKKYEITSTVNKTKYTNSSLSSITAVDISADKKTITYTFEISDNFRAMMAGKDLMIQQMGNEKDENGVESKQEKAKEISRTELDIAYINEIGGTNENKLEIWFSEEPRMTQHNIKVHLQSSNMDINSDYISVSVNKNIATVTIGRSTVSSDQQASIIVTDVVSTGGKSLINKYNTNVKLKENLECELINASYNYSQKLLELNFSTPVKGSTVKYLFNSIQFGSSNKGLLSAYPNVTALLPTVDSSNISLKIDINGNEASQRFLEYMMTAQDITLKTGEFDVFGKSDMLDNRDWKLKQKDVKPILLNLKGKPNVEVSQKGNTTLMKGQFFRDTQKLELTFSDAVVTENDWQNRLFNSIKFMYSKNDIYMESDYNYPKIADVSLSGNVVTVGFDTSTTNNFVTYINKNPGKLSLGVEQVYFTNPANGYKFIYDTSLNGLADNQVILEVLNTKPKVD
ncbi:cell wall-binding repeat-containing protein [Clostridium senegalense]|uniref:cell wall-binding repeat-containing protein n=1 Tax=Clostridium senegalense TaxID=1465809 RepID=UPI001C127E78|nr:cell wall-binding repeat-containing protein [Clostridium senegalense]MBU5228049.1 cell wall-binding repeat-containing protein [Clostridium senegalense]